MGVVWVFGGVWVMGMMGKMRQGRSQGGAGGNCPLKKLLWLPQILSVERDFKQNFMHFVPKYVT